MPSLQDPNSSSFAPKRKSSETANGAPKKPKDEDLYSHFTIVNLPDGNVSIACNHCSKFNKKSIKRFNPTHGRSHIVNVCEGVDRSVKRVVGCGSQSSRRMAREYALSSGPSETVTEM
jgi:hypothetical protein